MNEINSLKEIAQEIVDSYEGKVIDDLGIVELNRLKRDYRALHKLNLDLKNRMRFDEAVDTADYDIISQASEELWTLVQKELPVIEDVLSRKAQLAMAKTTRRRDVMANRARNLGAIKKIGDVVADLQASELNAGSPEVKAIYATPLATLKTTLEEMMSFDRKCDAEIKQLSDEIEILRMGGSIPEYERVKAHDEEVQAQVDEEKRAIVSKSNETKRFILDDAFKDGYVAEDMRVEGEIKASETPAKDAVYPVTDEVDYTKDDAFRYGYISNRGKFVADDAFKNGYATGDPLYIRDDAFKYGYVDNKGKFVADDAFKNGYLKEGKYIADDAFKFGYITKTGQWVNDDAFKNGYINADNRYIADDAFKYGFINLDSRFIADDAFKNGYINDNGDFVEDKDLKFGYMNKSGEYVADNAFRNGYINSENKYVADDAFKFGYLNTKGEFVADDSFKNGYSVEEKEENTGFILVGDTFKDEYPEDKGLNVEIESGEEEKEPTALVAAPIVAPMVMPIVGAAGVGGETTVEQEPEEKSTNVIELPETLGTAVVGGTPVETEEEATKTVVVPPVVTDNIVQDVEEFPEEEKLENFPVDEKLDSFPEDEKLEDFPNEEKIDEFPEEEAVESFPEEEEEEDKPVVAPIPRTKVISKKPAKAKLLGTFATFALAAVAALSAYMANKNGLFSKVVPAKAVVDKDEEEEDQVEEFAQGDEVVKPTPEPKPTPDNVVQPGPYYPSDPGTPYEPPVGPSEPDYPTAPEEPEDPWTPMPEDPSEPEPEYPGEPEPEEPGEPEPEDPGEPEPENPGEPEPEEPGEPEDPWTPMPEDPVEPEPEGPSEPEIPEGSILIDEGEAALDLDTGVEETYDGTLYDHSEGETDVPSGQDQTPTYTDDGASVITPDDLQTLPEPPAPPEEEPSTLAEAQEELSADEFDNLISAFNDEFVSGTSEAPAPAEPAPVESYEAPAETYVAPAESYEAPAEVAPAPVESYEAPTEAAPSEAPGLTLTLS